MIDPSARIHPSSDLERDVRVGAGSSGRHRARVRPGERIRASVGAQVATRSGRAVAAPQRSS